MAEKTRGSRLGRSLRHVLEYGVLRCAFAGLSILSPDRASALGGFLGRKLGPHLPVSERARRNLRLALPERDKEERAAIIAGMWDNLGRVAAEYPHLAALTQAEAGRVEVVGLEHVSALQDNDGGAILASGHFANWEIMPIMAARAGLDPIGVVREPNNPLVGRVIEGLRAVAGGRRVPKGAKGAYEAMAALRRGQVLMMLVDQKMNDGMAVPFFGHSAMTASAVAQLALRYGAPIVLVRNERLGGTRFRITCTPPIAVEPSGDRQADTLTLMTKINQVLEGWIRDKPEDWLWLHRRWPKDAYRSQATPLSAQPRVPDQSAD